MNYAALKAEIQTGSLAAELAPFIVSGSDAEIARILNDPRFTGPKSRIINARTILAEYPGGPIAASVVLDKLDASTMSAVKWAMSFIRGDGIDIGNPVTRSMLDQLASSGVITLAEAENLKLMGNAFVSRAEIALGSMVTHEQVGRALRGNT